MTQPTAPRMRSWWTPHQRVAAYAARFRVFTVDEIMRDARTQTAHGLAKAVTKGIVVRHSDEVYALPGIHPDDPRVTDAIRRTGKPPHDRAKVLEALARCEDRASEKIESALPGEPVEKLVDKFVKRNPAFLREDLVAARIGRTDEIIKELLRTGRIHQVDDILLRDDIEIDDPRVDDMLSARGETGDMIVAEIDAARKLPRGGTISYDYVRMSYERDGRTHVRPSRLHVDVPGCPRIYGIERGSNRDRGIDWHGDGVSRVTAEAIARKALHPMPNTLRELLADIDRGTAPSTMTRRNAGIPVAPSTATVRSIATKAVKLSIPCAVTVDASEDDEVLAGLHAVERLAVHRARLVSGDYLLRCGARRATIERKTVADLAASLDDGRLERQVPALVGLVEQGHLAFLLVEGNLHASELPPAKVLRIQTRLVALGIGMLTTPDRNGTAYLIASLARDLSEAETLSKAA